MNNPELIMEQIGSHRWILKGPKGNELTGPMYFFHADQAEEFARAYVSGFPCWNFRMKELKK